MKCVYVGFSPSKTAVIFPKNTVEFLFNGGSIIFIRVTLAEVQGERVIITNFCQVQHMACVAGVKRERGRGNLGARGRKERNACNETIVFSIFHAQIMSVKKVINQN